MQTLRHVSLFPVPFQKCYIICQVKNSSTFLNAYGDPYALRLAVLNTRTCPLCLGAACYKCGLAGRVACSVAALKGRRLDVRKMRYYEICVITVSLNVNALDDKMYCIR